MSMVWPTLGSRTAKEQNSVNNAMVSHLYYNHICPAILQGVHSKKFHDISMTDCNTLTNIVFTRVIHTYNTVNATSTL